MDDRLMAMIKDVDDDYLIGLSNKGTVKRAYKDLDQETPVVTWEEEGAKVALKEETCMIRMPLGESTCSCPSRSVCRHMITAILWLKKEASQNAGAEAPEENTKASEAPEEAVPAEEASGPKLLEEVLQIPSERLKRALKGRKYQQFLAHMRAGEKPTMEESSIVTVTIPWENATVKLLEPFAYSTCSCHSKELCAHKAQAVLAYQIEKGRTALADLDELEEESRTYDMEQVHQVCEGICKDVLQQIRMGLSRQSPEISESLNRLAVIAHRAELAELETRLRSAASEYRQYFARSAAFRNEELFRRLLDLYRIAETLRTAENQETIRKLAGSFRDTYEPAGKLHLLCMGGRTFSSKTGYEGEIYYFLEPEQNRWYTWTDARPVFYEGMRRRPPASSGNAPAPWGLNCSREQLQSLDFELQNARAASGGRLSVSQESKGEVLGERSLHMPEIKERIFWDYEELLKENFEISQDAEASVVQNRAAGRREKLVLAGAVGWGEAGFDTVQQRFSWSLYDRNRKKLSVSLKYTKEEKLTIQLLERLEMRLKKRPREAIVFFGSVYLDEEGGLCLYPIEFFLNEAEEIAREEGLTGGPGEAREEEQKGPSEDVLWSMEHYRRESVRQLSDLFISGLSSVQGDRIGRLLVLAEEGERMGLHYAGAKFADIHKALDAKRHQMEFSSEPVLQAAGELDTYFRVCREKLAYDMARNIMCAPEEED